MGIGHLSLGPRFTCPTPDSRLPTMSRVLLVLLEGYSSRHSNDQYRRTPATLIVLFGTGLGDSGATPAGILHQEGNHACHHRDRTVGALAPRVCGGSRGRGADPPPSRHRPYRHHLAFRGRSPWHALNGRSEFGRRFLPVRSLSGAANRARRATRSVHGTSGPTHPPHGGRQLDRNRPRSLMRAWRSCIEDQSDERRIRSRVSGSRSEGGCRAMGQADQR